MPFEDGTETPEEKKLRELVEHEQALENARPMLTKLWDYFQDKKESNPVVAYGAVFVMVVLMIVLSIVGVLNAVPK